MKKGKLNTRTKDKSIKPIFTLPSQSSTAPQFRKSTGDIIRQMDNCLSAIMQETARMCDRIEFLEARKTKKRSR